MTGSPTCQTATCARPATRVGILDLLRAYDRSTLSPDQQVSYDVYEWYLDDRVRATSSPTMTIRQSSDHLG